MSLPCPDPNCEGIIEASSKVYVDVTEAHFDGNSVVISDMEFSPLNDTYKGIPFNVEGELFVGCSGCGTEFLANFDESAAEETERYVVHGTFGDTFEIVDLDGKHPPSKFGKFSDVDEAFDEAEKMNKEDND